MISQSTQSLLPWNEATALSYTSVASPNNTTVSIATYARYTLGLKEAARSNGIYQSVDEKITFGFDSISGFEPKPTDLLTPSGFSQRIVISVNRNPMLRYWDLIARDLILVYSLRDSCDIKRPTVASGTGGLRTASYTTISTAVACKLNWDRTTFETDAAGKFLERKQYTLWLGEKVATQAGDIVEVSSVQYQVTEPVGFTFDGLAEVRCTRIA
jgi:hypothetical protein